MAALGPGIEKAVVAIGLVSIPEYARIVRSEILSIKENDYVAAARVIGDSNFAIVFRHVLPNVLPSIIVRATLGISTAILDAAALGFLGLGVQPPDAEWGDMLGRGPQRAVPRPVAHDIPRPGHHADRARLQPVGRRHPRRPGPQGKEEVIACCCQ